VASIRSAIGVIVVRYHLTSTNLNQEDVMAKGNNARKKETKKPKKDKK
jgi:hypothetical protein